MNLIQAALSKIKKVYSDIQQSPYGNVATQAQNTISAPYRATANAVVPAVQRLQQYTSNTPLAQSTRNYLATPLNPRQTQTYNRFTSVLNAPVMQVPRQFTSGLVQGSNLGFGGGFAPEPTTLAQKGAKFAGTMVGAFNPYSVTGKTTRGIVRATNPILETAISPVANKFVTGRLAAGVANVAQGTAINPLYGRKPLEGAAIDFATGALFGPNQFSKMMPKQSFTMDRRSFDELINAEEMLKNPKKFLGVEITGKRTGKEAILQIQEKAKEVIERLSAKYLPDKQLVTLKTPMAKLKALVNLNSQNKLANIEGMGIVSKSPLATEAKGVVGKWVDVSDKGGIPGESPEMLFKGRDNKQIAGLFQSPEGGWYIQRKDGTYLFNPETKSGIFKDDTEAIKEFMGKEITDKMKVANLPPITTPSLSQQATKYKSADYELVDRITGKKSNLAQELKNKPKFQKTEDADFNEYAKEYYRDFDKKLKPQLLESAKKEFPDLNVVDVDMSGSYKRGTPNPDSDLDAKVFYTKDVSEDVVAERMKTLWSDYGVHDVHPQKVSSLYNQAKGAKPITKEGGKFRLLRPTEKPTQTQKLADNVVAQSTRSPQLPQSQTPSIKGAVNQSSDDIILQARKEIGSTKQQGKNLKQTASDLYTQWVDRYNPITKASDVAQKSLKAKGAYLRPEYDPKYLVRRLTGAGGIADQRYQTQLKPIIDEMDKLKIPKADMDVYLKARRDIGLSTRGIKGSDAVKASERMTALEGKYGGEIQQLANKLYDYQNKGFQEMIDAGFISPEAGKTIRSANPDYVPFDRVMDEVDNYLGLPTRKTMQGTQPIMKIKGSERQILSPVESVIANTFKQRAAIEKNAVAKSITGLQQVAPELGFSKVVKSADDTITIWNNGQKEYWQVGKEIADTAKGLNEENMNALLKIFTAPASLLRQGATGRNPEFMLPNILRDNLDAGISSKYGYVPFVDYISGLKSMIANDTVYQKWANSGAKIDLGQMSGRKTIKQSFEKVGGKHKLFSWLGGALDTMGKYSEQPTRVGLFKKAYKKTGNELLSMMESRDATVDFARMGSKMRTANSIVPFLNVGVQGFDKLIRSVKDNPGKVALNAGMFAALPAITSTLYNLKNYPEEYAEIPQYEKDSNFVLVKGRNENGAVDYVSFPKGNIIPVIANPIENFLAFTAQQDTQTLGEFATKFISSTLPVIGDGQSPSEVALKTIGSNLPQLVKPITENLLNKSFWKYDPNKEQAKEIVPSYMNVREPYQQNYEWTPELYNKIGAVFDVSPLKVQNLMEGYLAGYTKIPAQIIDNLKATGRGEEVNPNDKTILRRFIKQTYPSSGTPAVQQDKTPFMERVTGKVGAAEKGTIATPNDWQIQNAKYKLKKSTETSMDLGNLLLYKKDPTDPNSDIGTMASSWTEPSLPEITEQEPWDNAFVEKQISDYKSNITSRQSDVMKLYDLGKMDYKTAMDEYLRLDELKKTATNKVTKPKAPKKAKKISVKKISLPKITKVKSVKIKRVKSLRSKPMKKVKFRSKL